MSDNAEAGIAATQANAARSQGSDGLKNYHNQSIVYINERIVVAILAIAFIGLMITWMTVKSPVILYSSLAAVILLVVLWGFVRIRSIERIKKQRAAQAESWDS